MSEVEAKFLIEHSAQPQQLIDALQSCGAKLTQVSAVDVLDRYFDTPEWDLLQGGWTYRWRDISGKRNLGLKSTNSATGAIRTREEVEQEVAKFPDDGIRVSEGPIAKRLAKVRQDRLRELFRIDNHRQLFQLRTSDGASIEMALDHAIISSAASEDKEAEEKMQFAELELELIDGPECALQKLAAEIQQRLELLPSRLSKFERSLRPLGLHSPRTLCKEIQQLDASSFLLKLRKRPLKRKNPTIKLAYRCLLEQFEVLLTEEPIAWEGLEIAGVHQMRVATRRIRAALWAFKSVIAPDRRVEFNGEFKWLARVLGQVRDLDVLQRDLLGYIDRFPAEEAISLEDYRQRLVKQSKSARKQLIDCLSGDRYRTLKSNFSDFLKLGPPADISTRVGKEPIGDAAVRLLGKQYKRVLHDGRLITSESPDTDLHALRIDCKRLRYLFEFFRSVYGKSLNPYIKPLRTLQNVLGEFQDANVAMGQLYQQAQCVPMLDENRAQLLALGQLIADQRFKATDRRAGFRKVWKRFDHRRTRKRLLEVLS